MRIAIEDAIARYGAIEGGKWPEEAKWCMVIHAPAGLTWKNTATGMPVDKIYCNKDMADALGRALCNVYERGLSSQLRSFDGCYMVRDVRGQPGSISCHSYALAIDINADTNRLGTDGDITDELAKCFMDEGFTWGKSFHRRDPMHFSFGWE